MNIAICGIWDFGGMDEKLVVYRIDTSGALVERIIADVAESRIATPAPIMSLRDGSLLIAC